MGILALAAIPLMQLVSNSIRSGASLEQRLLARTVAENVLVQEVIQAAAPAEDAIIQTGFSEQMGRRFNWRVITSPVQEAQPQFVVVEVRLDQNVQVLAQLTGVRAPALPNFGNEASSEAGGEQR